MTEQQRQEIKVKLIDLGLWSADEEGDPVTDRLAIEKLHNRIEEKLAPGFAVVSSGSVGNAPHRQICFVRGDFRYSIAVGDTYGEAICQAAVLLPEFLKQHPDYAAQK